jgi:hypothetical protein
MPLPQGIHQWIIIFVGDPILHYLTNFLLSSLACPNCQLPTYNTKGLLTFQLF